MGRRGCIRDLVLKKKSGSAKLDELEQLIEKYEEGEGHGHA